MDDVAKGEPVGWRWHEGGRWRGQKRVVGWRWHEGGGMRGLKVVHAGWRGVDPAVTL